MIQREADQERFGDLENSCFSTSTTTSPKNFLVSRSFQSDKMFMFRETYDTKKTKALIHSRFNMHPHTALKKIMIHLTKVLRCRTSQNEDKARKIKQKLKYKKGSYDKLAKFGVWMGTYDIVKHTKKLSFLQRSTSYIVQMLPSIVSQNVYAINCKIRP